MVGIGPSMTTESKLFTIVSMSVHMWGRGEVATYTLYRLSGPVDHGSSEQQRDLLCLQEQTHHHQVARQWSVFDTLAG